MPSQPTSCARRVQSINEYSAFTTTTAATATTITAARETRFLNKISNARGIPESTHKGVVDSDLEHSTIKKITVEFLF